MILTFEIPDNAKNIKVSFVCDDKPYQCKEARYSPGRWNGLNGGSYYGQYFDMENESRVREMTEVATALHEYDIPYILTKLKRQYRIMISNEDYRNMEVGLKKRINAINCRYDYERECE